MRRAHRTKLGRLATNLRDRSPPEGCDGFRQVIVQLQGSHQPRQISGCPACPSRALAPAFDQSTVPARRDSELGRHDSDDLDQLGHDGQAAPRPRPERLGGQSRSSLPTASPTCITACSLGCISALMFWPFRSCCSFSRLLPCRFCKTWIVIGLFFLAGTDGLNRFGPDPTRAVAKPPVETRAEPFGVPEFLLHR